MIHLKNLKKTFGENVAVADISLDILPGEVFGLLGPNGAGKTTTVNMAVGLLRPDSGQVDIAGNGSPDNPAVRRLIGMAPQATALYDELSAEENLYFFGRLQQLHGTYLKQRVEESLVFAGLTERKRDRVGTFSGAIWRQFTFVEMLRPCSIILGVGILCFTIGVHVFRKTDMQSTWETDMTSYKEDIARTPEDVRARHRNNRIAWNEAAACYTAETDQSVMIRFFSNCHARLA